MFHIYGCPMHYGVGDKGLIYSLDYLCSNYDTIKIDIVPELTCAEDNLPNLKHLNSILATCQNITHKGLHILRQKKSPLFIAGDHSAVIGSISASSIYLKESLSADLGLIWIDAHPDINTDKTTVSGNIHGMPIAALLGMGETSLTRIGDNSQKLKPENIVMLGIRDIDPPEADFLKKLNIRHYTYDDILSKGLSVCLSESAAYLSHLKGIHLSLDIDSMDPLLMPGVSSPVARGFNKKDILQMLNAFSCKMPIIAYDVVEFNHEHDIDNQTSDFVAEIINTIIAD